MKIGISDVRRHLVRDAVIYTPLAILALVAWVASLAAVISAGGGGGIFLLILITILVLLAGYQSIQSLRDLWSSPVTTEGPVRRKWRRHEFLLFPAYYFYVGSHVFKVPQLAYEAFDQGDLISITHYPHTAAVIAVMRVERRQTGEEA